MWKELKLEIDKIEQYFFLHALSEYKICKGISLEKEKNRLQNETTQERMKNAVPFLYQ